METKSIALALAKAQAEMGRALKESNNPAFRSKYADLGNVVDACLPALNKHEIAVIQPVCETEAGRVVKTILIHSSGECLECAVPLIVGKNDMQGLGSAITYGRRYGLMSMAGIAPEDDDGNAAAKGAPKPDTSRISADQFRDMTTEIDRTGSDPAKMMAYVGAQVMEELTVSQWSKAMDAMRKKPAKPESEAA